MDADPRRGEIWVVSLESVAGLETPAERLALVLSSDAFREETIRLVVPIIGWQDHFAVYRHHVRVPPSAMNGLLQNSAVDVLRVRCIPAARFARLVGRMEADLVEEAAAGVIIAIDYFPS